MKLISLILILVFLTSGVSFTQCLTLGADLSYVNTIGKNNGVYRDENGNIIEPFSFFADKGCDMVRLRLWHTPSNISDHCGNPILANSLEDVLESALKANTAGMQIMLAIHYGDYFNDPGKQKRPAAWDDLPHEVLLDSIYLYTFRVLEKMEQQGTLPSIVGIGNETTWGFIDETSTTDGWKWPEDAEKFNTALKAVDDFNATYFIGIKKAIHFTESSAEWATDLFTEQSITNYDIIGISYYPFFSPDTDLDNLGNVIKSVKNSSLKEVMIFETGFVWKTDGWADDYNNILNHNGNVLNYPVSPEGQRNFLFQLSQTVRNNGGTGVFYWEPGYISSEMCTKWGQGSPYENVCFFDYRNNNTALPAFDFFEFCDNSETDTTGFHGITVCPIPTEDGYVYIKANIPIAEWFVYDLNGKLLKKANPDNFQKPIVVDVSDLENGIYLLLFQGINGTYYAEKIVLAFSS